MYKLHLILKYLRKRRIAWVSLIAVMLCTTMVLVVISVMGGWLRMFREQFHGLTGEILVQSDSLGGFPYYQDMIDRIEKLPDVSAAVPVIKTLGLINIENSIRTGVQVVGIPIDRIGQVNAFPESLFRQHKQILSDIDAELADPKTPPTERQQLLRTRDQLPAPSFALLPNVDYQDLVPDQRVNVRNWPGMIVGTGLVGINKKHENDPLSRLDLYRAWARLSLVKIDPEKSTPDLRADQVTIPYWIVDDSHTNVYPVDAETVYVSFSQLQKELDMDEQSGWINEQGQPQPVPARTSEIQIKVRPGADLVQVNRQVQAIVAQVRAQHQISSRYPTEVHTWDQTRSVALYLSAVEKEKSLVTFLFGLISIVAIFLIFCIFYMIVVEKTRDIGIIKSVGATGSGVAGIFLGYGAAIGITGSGLGLLLSYLIVHNINWLHTKMAELTGTPIWNPEVYAFDIIPNTMNPHEVAWIVAIAIVASILGALVPAVRAARMHPVEALRWE